MATENFLHIVLFVYVLSMAMVAFHVHHIDHSKDLLEHLLKSMPIHSHSTSCLTRSELLPLLLVTVFNSVGLIVHVHARSVYLSLVEQPGEFET